jgi:glycosyltransferase involved in cell wall biosynthesis
VTVSPAASTSEQRASSVRSPRPVRRVLHVFHSLGMGGAETWLVALLEWLAINGESLPFELQVEVCLTGGERAIFDDRVEALGAKLHYIRYQRRQLGKFTRQFRRLLANGRFDAIHDHADYAGGVHLLLGLGELPPARVIHVHNPFATFGGSGKERIVRAIGRQAVARLATTVAGTSRRILEEYHFAPDPHSRQRRVAIHCGFDLSLYADDAGKARRDVRAEFEWSAETKILLFVGRLESHFNQKNPQFAIDVALECIARNDGVRALFVGAGDGARQEIQTELERRGMADRIRLSGIRFDVPRLMLAADLLLFPSVAEGLGMVAVEAQAAGLRVLASDTTPRECEVVAGMVTFASLALPATEWADRALALIDAPPVDHAVALDALSDSGFSIGNSALALFDAYGLAVAPS